MKTAIIIGKAVCTGAKTIGQSKQAVSLVQVKGNRLKFKAQFCTDSINDVLIMLDFLNYESLSYKDFTVQNMVCMI